MHCYHFRIADLLLRVESPGEIPCFHELSPYQVGDSEKPEAVYRIVLFDGDLQPEGENLYRSRRTAVYQRKGMIQKFFYWDPRNASRYVLLEQPDVGDCTVYIRREEWDLLLPQLRLSAFFSIEQLLLEHQAFQLHASVIQWCGHGVLFCASSGTGKSTQAELWHTYANATIINGDRGLIRFSNNGYRVYGAPYAGSSGIYSNLSAPVLAVVTLEQGKENQIRKMEPMEAFRKLYREVTVPVWNGKFVEGASGQLLDFIGRVPVYHLICRPDRDAVDVLRNTLQTICR